MRRTTFTIVVNDKERDAIATLAAAAVEGGMSHGAFMRLLLCREAIAKGLWPDPAPHNTARKEVT